MPFLLRADEIGAGMKHPEHCVYTWNKIGSSQGHQIYCFLAIHLACLNHDSDQSQPSLDLG